MSDSSKYVSIFTGPLVSVKNLESQLAAEGISSIIEDEFQSSITAGFGASSSSIHLLISEEDLERAKPIIEGFQG